MELMRIGAVGEERPVAKNKGEYYWLDSLEGIRDIDGSFLSLGGIERVRDALEAGRLEIADISRLRIGPPIARPSVVLCVGQNYAAHAAEAGSEPPRYPIMFFKHPNTIVGPYDDVYIPRQSVKTDWEIELAVVIGKQARYLDSPQESRSVIAGCTISNDVSERRFQIEESGGQWSKGKSCETFNPLGPVLVPSDEIEEFQELGLRSFVNGQPRQASNTKDMIFGVEYLVWYFSQYMILEPGDVINTGTPEGVAFSGRFPYLRRGDTVRLEIDRLGHQQQRFIDCE